MKIRNAESTGCLDHFRKILLLICLFIFSSGLSVQASNSSPSSVANNMYKRVVVLTASQLELMDYFDIDLVGIPETKSYVPERYKSLPTIGFGKINIEVLMSLEPDLFIASKGSEAGTKEQLKNIDIPTVYLDTATFNSAYDSIIQIGEIFGQKEKAEAFVRNSKERDSKTLSDIAELKGKKVALFYGNAKSFKVMTKDSYIGSMLEMTGAQNITSDVETGGKAYVDMDLESILAKEPEIIIAVNHALKEEAVHAYDGVFESSAWKNVPAVIENRIYPVSDYDLKITGGIRNSEYLRKLVNLMKTGEMGE